MICLDSVRTPNSHFEVLRSDSGYFFTGMLSNADINRLAAKVAEQVLQMTDELMTPQQAAEYLGCSVNALQLRRAKTLIPSHKRDGAVYYSKRELTEYYLTDK